MSSIKYDVISFILFIIILVHQDEVDLYILRRNTF